MYFKSQEKFMAYLEAHPVQAGEELMIFLADGSARQLPGIMEELNGLQIPFFGGIYPGLLVGPRHLTEGLIVQRLKPLMTTLVVPHLMRLKLDLTAFKEVTALVLVDGLSSKMKELTDTIHGKLGNQVKYLGGGAGYSDLKHRPCLFNNRGVYSDVLIVSLVPAAAKIGVKHGWNRLAGPFLITKSRENVLSELDHESAFELYRHIVEEEENITLYAHDFFTFAKDHPFGIKEKGQVDVVRDPISLNEDNEIVCVADIPQQREVYVLKGDTDTLLAASKEVSAECAQNPFENYTPLLFDCISRALFMEARFGEELANVQKQMRHPVLGTLCIGEIASLENGEPGIHNKSTVLGVVQL